MRAVILAFAFGAASAFELAALAESNRDAPEDDVKKRKKMGHLGKLGCSKMPSWTLPKSASNISYFSGEKHKRKCVTKPLYHELAWPRQCNLGLCDGVKCLAKQNVSNVVVIGDSVALQLLESLRCDKPSCGYWQPGFASGSVNSRKLTLHHEAQSTTLVQLIRVCSQGMASLTAACLRTLSEAERALLAEPAVWLINQGLHHLLCVPGNVGYRKIKSNEGPSDCLDRTYPSQLRSLLATISELGRGHFYWRDTTAVEHEMIPGTVNNTTAAKFKHFNNDMVVELNRLAAQTVAEFPNIKTIPHAFELTRAAGKEGHLPGDSRHFGGDVLNALNKLVFAHALCPP